MSEEEKGSDARAKLEQKLGQLAYQIGKQSTKMNREQQILQNLQNEANKIATEIEKMDK